MLKKVSILFILYLIFSNTVWATNEAPGQVAAQDSIVDKKPLSFTVDWNRFRYDEETTFLEFTASLYRDQLTFQQADDGKMHGEFIVLATITQADTVVEVKKWRNIDSVDSLTSDNRNQRLSCLNSFALKKGDYKLDVEITDVFDSENTNKVSVDVPITEFSSGRLRISDAQLASTIKKSAQQTIYTKNGFEIIPNPSALYGIGLPILYTYMEIYNLTEATTDSGATYSVKYKVLDSEGAVVKEAPLKTRKKPGGSSVEVNSLNVVTLVSAPYILQVEVTDNESGQKSVTERRFFVYREADFAEGGAAFEQKDTKPVGLGSPGVDADRYDTMDEKELDLEFDWVRYIAENQEISAWKKLNLQGKRGYIKEFWAKRDETPGTPANEYKELYLARIQKANKSLRAAFRDGYKSDRGRVLLVYGDPDEIERFPYGSENKPYEVWHYFSIQGGVSFVFVDKRDMNDYELVHSTARGELYDTEWTRWIATN